jgi:hypothetical protein
MKIMRVPNKEKENANEKQSNEFLEFFKKEFKKYVKT